MSSHGAHGGGPGTHPDDFDRDFDPVRGKVDELALKRGYYFDIKSGQRVARFIETFYKPSKGAWAGRPLKLIPWQRDAIYLLYGWKTAEGLRRYRSAYWQLPKKSGKTGLASALCLYHLLGDNEPGAEVYVAARNRNQASICFEESAAAVRQCPDLARRLKIVPSTKRIVHEASNSVFRALSSDSDSHDGLNCSMACIDELHRHSNARLFNVLRYAGAARRQPLVLTITTAGRDRNSVCYAQYKFSKDVNAGLVEDLTHMGLIYEMEEGDDWADPAVWHRANPSLGHTIQLEDFAADCERAKVDPVAREEFLQLRLNRWLARDAAWLQPGQWELGNGPASIPPGSEVYLGIDLSSVHDQTAIVMVAIRDGVYHVLPFCFIPREQAELRNQRDSIQYMAWRDAGLIELTPGPAIDYDLIEQRIRALSEDYRILKVWADRWSAQQLCSHLVDAGMVVEFVPQGIKLSPWIKDAERLIARGEIRHGGHPLLAWQAANVVTQTDSMGNKRISKPSPHSPLSVDAMLGLVMALGAAQSQTELNTADAWDGTMHFV